MTYQTLDQAIGKTNKDGDWVATNLGTVTNPVADIMLERLGAALYDPDHNPAAGSATEPGDPFVLTNTHADNAIANVRDLVGAYVTAYANDDYEIIAIKEVKSVFLTGEFDKTFAAGAWPANTDFETDDQDYDLEIASLTYTNGTDDFYNGETGALTAVVPTAGATYKIAADVSGKKIKDIYSVSEWSINDDFLFEDDMLEDDNLNSHDFKLDDNDEIEAGSYALVGVDSLEDIEEGNVVYVYTAAGEITRIEVGTEVVTGTVTRISSDAKTITVDGKAYKYADDQLTLSGPDVTANGGVSIDDEVELTLDVNGYIYSIDSVTSSGGNYAMVLEVEDKTSGLSGRDAAVELFLADGTTKVFNVDSDFADTNTSLINKGAWVNPGSARFDTTPATKGKALVTLLVEYSVDKDGVIDFIDEVSFTNSTTTAATTELTSRNYYDGYAVASDAIMFTYDGTDPSDDDNYGVTTVAKASGSKFAADYLVKSQKIKVMVTAGLGTAADEVYGVFVGKAEVSGGTGYEVTMLVDGKEVVYEATPAGYAAVDATLNTLEAEDQLLRLEFNAAGELKDAVAAFNDDAVVGPPASPDTGFVTADTDVNYVAVDSGLTITVKNNVATITATNVSGANGWATFGSGEEITLDSDAIIYKVNSDGDWVKGSISDLKLTSNNTKVVSFFDVFDKDKVADIVLIK
jgi:hypothetical protein